MLVLNKEDVFRARLLGSGALPFLRPLEGSLEKDVEQRLYFVIVSMIVLVLLFLLLLALPVPLLYYRFYSQAT